jgi:histidinol dehydrogenase
MAITIRKLDSTRDGFDAELRTLLAFEASEDEAIEQRSRRSSPT